MVFTALVWRRSYVLDLIPLSPILCLCMDRYFASVERGSLENITGLFLDISSFCVQWWSNNKEEDEIRL